MENLNLVFVLMAGEIYTCRIEKNECINHKLKGVQGYPIQSKGDIDEWIEDLCESLSIDPEEFEEEELECTVINMDWDMPMVLRLLKTLDTKTSKVIDGISAIPGIVLNKCEIKAGAEYSVNILGVAWKIKVSEAMELSCELEGSSSNGVAIGIEEFIFPYTWKGKFAYSDDENDKLQKKLEEKEEIIQELTKKLDEKVAIIQKQEKEIAEKEYQFGIAKKEHDKAILEKKTLEKNQNRLVLRCPVSSMKWSNQKQFLIERGMERSDASKYKNIMEWNDSHYKRYEIYRTGQEKVNVGDLILVFKSGYRWHGIDSDDYFSIKAKKGGKLIYIVEEGQYLNKDDVFAVIAEHNADEDEVRRWVKMKKYY